MIQTIDIAVFGFWLMVFTILLLVYRNIRLKNDPAVSYFLIAFYLHVIGGIAFSVIYIYYYGFGDTFGFYNIFKVFRQSIEDDPGNVVPVLTSYNMDYFNSLASLYGYQGWYAMAPSTISVSKAAVLFSFFAGQAYLPLTLFFSFFSFCGNWAMYRTFQKVYPTLYKELAFLILLFPSIWFWGSGFSKDSLTFGALGFLLYGTYQLFFKRTNILQGILFTIVSGYILFYVKPYVLVAFLPSSLSWLIIGYQQRLKNPALKRIFFSVCLLLLVGGFALINQFLSTNLEQFSLENVQANMLGYRAGLDTYADAGSVYGIFSIGSGNVAFFSMLVPAVITTFFRPFPWEFNNVFSLLAVGESFFMLLLFWKLLRRIGLNNMLQSLYREPIILFCVIFSIIFGISVGIASQNFGTLVRYRLPAIPFFMASMLIAYYHYTGHSLFQKRQRLSRSLSKLNQP